MIHHPLESKDDFSVGRSVTPGKVLVQITSNLDEQQARGVFTEAEAVKMALLLSRVAKADPVMLDRVEYEVLKAVLLELKQASRDGRIDAFTHDAIVKDTTDNVRSELSK